MTISSKALCPFYKREESQVVYCAGITPDSAIHLAFASKTSAVEYKKSMCQNKFCTCPIYQMVERIGEA